MEMRVVLMVNLSGSVWQVVEFLKLVKPGSVYDRSTSMKHNA